MAFPPTLDRCRETPQGLKRSSGCWKVNTTCQTRKRSNAFRCLAPSTPALPRRRLMQLQFSPEGWKTGRMSSDCVNSHLSSHPHARPSLHSRCFKLKRNGSASGTDHKRKREGALAGNSALCSEDGSYSARHLQCPSAPPQSWGHLRSAAEELVVLHLLPNKRWGVCSGVPAVRGEHAPIR